MAQMRFEEPVTILVGMGLPVTIETAVEAYAMLQDWPVASRNGAHAVALNACKAGIAGEIDAETVRATLIAFARRNDILRSADRAESADRGVRGTPGRRRGEVRLSAQHQPRVSWTCLGTRGSVIRPD